MRATNSSSLRGVGGRVMARTGTGAGTSSYEVRHGRPEPDEAPLEDVRRPELEQRGLSRPEWLSVVRGAGKKTIADNMPMIAQALAYSTFMAIPAVLLVALGVFTLLAGPQTIASLMQHFGSVMPQQATQLLGQSLTRLSSHRSAGLTLTLLGLLLALWSTTGAMT